MAKKARKTAKAGGGGRSRSRSKPSTAPTVPLPENDDSKRELFLHHRTAWNGAMAKVKAADKILDEVKAALKKDGLTIQEFKIADELTTQRGEIKIKSEVTTRLRVARWIGHPMGQQLDMFARIENTKRNWYDEGKQLSMENKPLKPPAELAVDSAEYRDFTKGYHDHQAKIVPGAKNGGVPRPAFHEHLQTQHKDAEAAIKAASGAVPTPPTVPPIGDQAPTHQIQG